MIHRTSEIDPLAQIGISVQIWQFSHVREGAQIGAHSTLGRNVYVGPGVIIGERCKVQNGCQIYEPAVIGSGVFLGPNVVLTNDRRPRAVMSDGRLKGTNDWTRVGVQIGDGASVGAGSIIVAPVNIGPWAMVAAGSVVTSDVLEQSLVAGVPAVEIGKVCRCGTRLSISGAANQALCTQCLADSQ